ncbi:MAG: hypothetical protein ACRDZR_10025 [Acidimicrobiales bacterium]
MPVADILGDNQLEKMLALDSTLAGLGIRYAFGGAIALDYYVEPRATSDADVMPWPAGPDILERFDEAMRPSEAAPETSRRPVSGC